MRRARILVPALSLGLLAGSLIVAPVQAAPPPPSVDATAFAPTLTYVTCPADEKLPPRTRCATLTVPLDWQTPDDGKTIEIALRVTRSKQRGGGFTFNPGGPGGSGTEIGLTVYSLLPTQVRDRFDFVSWDPRGVGLSGPALTDCSPSAAADLPATGPVDWQAYWEAQLAATAAANAACLAANPDTASALGTWQVIRDLEAMRIALGYAQWNYWGMSYGTRIGNAYARTFPTSLRALIMDGSVRAGETLYRLGTTWPAGVQVAQQVYASLNGRAQAHKINTILTYLDDSVITVGGSSLTRWDFYTYVGPNGAFRRQANYPEVRARVNSLYDYVTAPTPSARARALRGLGDTLTRILQGNDIAVVNPLVNCADLPDRPTASQIAAASIAAERQYGTASPRGMINASQCAGLPADMSPASPNGTSTITLATPPMFVLSTGDPATAWVGGRSMANTFARSRTISYAGTQHVTYLRTPSACVNDPVTRYLLTLQRPRADISCAFTPSPPPPPQ
ncbi:MAG: alpha/beta fold hydrolase, partial [Candidatus Nanopelagicales bacterium]|jgi:pimeloyl-ACP methyl ester carboxylesterase|nr:alpha/beta fold hydrolase [Candidatus Nanopelagicales bacterium]